MWEDYNTQCYGPHENPECICWRDVANEVSVSPWYAWQGIKNNPTMQEFFDAVDRYNMNHENLVLRAHEDGKGIVLDYRLRKQFWIPKPSGWDLDFLRTPLESRYKNKDKLKRCPFCGGEAELIILQELRIGGPEGWVVVCKKCGMNTATINGTYYSWRSDAIESWNKRITDI